MKIVIFEAEEWEAQAFKPLEADHEVVYTEDPLRLETVDDHADADVVSTFIYSRLGSDVLRRLPNLKMLATRSTGVDHIDLEYCRSKDIRVCNVPEYGENTVAEHAFGLLLTVSHKLDQAIDRTRKGDFSPKGLTGFDLYGKTLGIIGTGNIGRHAARIGRGFAMNVIAYDIAPDQEAAIDYGFTYVSFDELLEQSDVISLHVPATPETRHMLSKPQFQKMKDGVVIINTARGDVVDIRALVRGIAEKKVAGAGLDVLPEEPVIREEAELLRSMFQEKHNLETLLADHVVLHLRNVVVTPHSAFNTKEAVQRILDTTLGNIQAFAEDRQEAMAAVA
jgi:D-lactate dehydrogenase